MKLYYDHHAAPFAHWQLPGKQERKAVRVEVPGAAAELCVWLNNRDVRATAPTFGGEPGNYTDVNEVGPQLAREITDWVEQGCEEPPQDLIERVTKQPRVAGFCDACGRSAAGTLKLSCGHDLDELGQWLEDVQLDQLWMLQRAAELIRDRVRALGGTLEGGSVQ